MADDASHGQPAEVQHRTPPRPPQPLAPVPVPVPKPALAPASATPAAESRAPPTSAMVDRPAEPDRRKIVAFKVTHVLLTVFFLWLMTVHVLGMLFFAKGFLLTRLVLEEQSECHVLPNGEPSTTPAANGCWHPKSFDRAVFLIIDALRYDFTVPSNRSLHRPAPSHYRDRLPLLHELAVSAPEHAVLLPFIADPPTSTLQRLKALTTGTLPTFIDIGSNFAGTAIEEDNLVSQWKEAGKTLVQLGDNTWQSLFPGMFDPDMTRPYDSFKVWDLHSVDEGVIEHIMPLLDQAPARWDVLVGHFLGVDHAGHRYGPDHPAMADKLAQMNDVLQAIVHKLDHDTLLVVLGDHGMDAKGNHGGESDDEVEAALWMFAKRPHFGRLDDQARLPPATAKERPVGQIDLVSTLALLLGLPIPFNNLGRPIAEAFAGPALGRPNWRNLATVAQLAQQQIARYQRHYAQSRDLGLPDDAYAAQRSYLAQSTAAAAAGRWEEAYRASVAWHTDVVSIYRKLWANFNLLEMLGGVTISASALAFVLFYANGATGDRANGIAGLLRRIALGSGLGVAVGPVLGIVLSSYFSAVGGLVVGATVGGVAAGAAWCRQYRFRRMFRPPSLWGWLAMLFCLTQSAGFASNSYTIHEDTILLFFLTTFGLLALVSSLRQAYQADRVLGSYQSAVFVLLTRLASLSRLCREEQMPGCRSTFHAASTSSTTAAWRLLIPYLVALLLPELIKAFYKGTASYAGSTGFWIGGSFRLGLALVAVYWTVDAAENAGWLADTFAAATLKTLNLTLARAVFAIAVPIGIGTFTWAKPCIEIAVTEPSRPAAPADSAHPAASAPTRPQLKIFGYANVYGSRYFLMVPILVLSVVVLLPPMGQLAVAICAWQVLCLLEMLDANALTVAPASRSTIGPIVLALLGSYHFFTTGHQATLASIQWNSAFVPLRNIAYPWSPLLVTLNTFGAQILCAAAVPLVVLWKRPIGKTGPRGLWNDVFWACLTHLLYYATIQLATTLWAGHLRRHLMLYRVFMPRYLMACVVLIVVDLVLIVAALSGARVVGLSSGEVFGYGE